VSDQAKLTPAACRAGRALLKWSVRDLMREAGVSPNTVTALENGADVRAETAAKILAAFAAHRVEITNGDGTGARLLSS
jgi:transcriptional regulator with XRE-family HTH domain